MKRMIYLFLMILLINGCTDTDIVKEDADIQELPDRNFTIEELNDKSDIKEDADIQELPDRNFTIEELNDKLELLQYKSNYIFKVEDKKTRYLDELKSENKDIIRSDFSHKTWIMVNGTNFNNIENFYDYVKSPKWDAWRYYINETILNWVHDPMTKEQVKKVLPNYDYEKRYASKADNSWSKWIEYDISERPIKTKIGTILEYIRVSTTIDGLGQSTGLWDEAFVIYKFPCTKDIVIYHRPRWNNPIWGNDIGTFWASGYPENNIRLFKEDIKDNLDYFIEQIDEIMTFCGIKSNMFNDNQIEEYNEEYQKVLNWDIYYRTIMNSSFDAKINIKDKGDKIIIDQVNYTFTYYDDTELLKNVPLYVEVEIDNKGNIIKYNEAKMTSHGGLKSNEIIEKSFKKESSLVSKDSKVIFRPYIGYGSEYTVELERYYIGEPFIMEIG